MWLSSWIRYACPMTDPESADPVVAVTPAVGATSLREAAQAAIDQKTKPAGSLGYLEQVAVQLAVLQQTLEPDVDPARVLVFAADHGVTDARISAFPQAVTAQMMQNFAAGGAAVCVLGKAAGASLEVVDVGVAAELPELAGVVHEKVRAGTHNMLQRAAMSHEDLDAALAVGRRAMVRAAEAGVKCIGLGEMGIGNTTSAAVLTGLLTGSDANTVTGSGTGVDGAALAHKRDVVARCLQRFAAHADDPLECLRHAGGLEIAALVGAMLEARAHRIAVLVDGYIVTAAALVACQLKPAVRHNMFFAHRSSEPGHRVALEQLDARPLLDLGMRLGEGSATALAIPLLRGAARVLRDMATFASAGVSNQ